VHVEKLQITNYELAFGQLKGIKKEQLDRDFLVTFTPNKNLCQN